MSEQVLGKSYLSHYVVECYSNLTGESWVPMSEEFESLEKAEAYYDQAKRELSQPLRLVLVQEVRQTLYRSLNRLEGKT